MARHHQFSKRNRQSRRGAAQSKGGNWTQSRAADWSDDDDDLDSDDDFDAAALNTPEWFDEPA